MKSAGFELDTSCGRYLETRSAAEGQAVALLGVPYDGTSSFRPGSRFGPDAIRAASVSIETYSPLQDRDLEDMGWVDLGNLIVPTGAPGPVVELVRLATAAIVDEAMIPLLLGGEHTITTGAVHEMSRRFEDLSLIQLDAHADLRPSYQGDRHNHSCTIRRCLEILPSEVVIQVGIRAGTREEFSEMRTTGRLIPPDPQALMAALRRVGERPIYLTIDLDVFDSSLCPGTGTPEPGGIQWSTFEALLLAIPEGRLVAADVVELAPSLDPSGASSILAAKVVREVALRLGRFRD